MKLWNLKITKGQLSVLAIGSLLAGAALAGSLEPPGPPAPTMVTLQQIYDELSTVPGQAGSLQPPAGAPAPTMVTLQGIYTAAAAGGPRFTDRGNGTVKDNVTGLIWLKNANCFGQKTWDQARAAAAGLASGQCGLTDGSTAGQWYLPSLSCVPDESGSCTVSNARNLRTSGGEFTTLFGPGCGNGVLNTEGTGCWTEGNPFTGVRSNEYWSSSTYTINPNEAFIVAIYWGDVLHFSKIYLPFHVWPVRGGP